jgi:hypothetical protein
MARIASRTSQLEIEELRLQNDTLTQTRTGKIGNDLDAFLEEQDFTLINEIGTGVTKIRVYQNMATFLCALETPVKVQAIFVEDVLALSKLLVGLNFVTNRTVSVIKPTR